jgi:hypothetical protein
MPIQHPCENIPLEAGHFIAGFVDGEGNFFVSIRQCKDYLTKWKFSLTFSLGNNDRVVLNYCQKYLGCGKIRESRPGFFILEVNNLMLLKQQILPFFQRFQFRSNKKRREFRIFQLLLRELHKGPILCKPRLLRFLKYREQLGRCRKERWTHTDEIILPTFCFQNTLLLTD